MIPISQTLQNDGYVDGSKCIDLSKRSPLRVALAAQRVELIHVWQNALLDIVAHRVGVDEYRVSIGDQRQILS